MKHILLIIACLFMASSQAQKPEPVYSFARVHKPLSWYKDQKAAWKKEIEKDPKNALAWYYYYYAQRDLLFSDSTDKRPFSDRRLDINKTIEDMGKAIPETYEYNLVKWQDGGFDMSKKQYYDKALALGPDRTEHLDFVINFGELERDIPGRDRGARLKYEAGQISSGMMYYNCNVLAGLEPNAILITVGDNDTYPAYVLQSQGFRRDVTVINTSLLMIDSYREKLFKELGVEKWVMDWGTTEESSKNCNKKYCEGIIKHIAANKKGLPVYVGLTAAGCEEYITPIQENLYLTGLAYKYSTASMDNIALVKRNFEQLYALDYIDKAFYSDISKELVMEINRNYIVPMLKLYDHYKASGDSQKQAWIKQKLVAVSKGTADEDEVKKRVASN